MEEEQRRWRWKRGGGGGGGEVEERRWRTGDGGEEMEDGKQGIEYYLTRLKSCHKLLLAHRYTVSYIRFVLDRHAT